MARSFMTISHSSHNSFAALRIFRECDRESEARNKMMRWKITIDEMRVEEMNVSQQSKNKLLV